ncbi:hypothetical protein C8J56DRAFT_925315 [Mycena floridula]|nr:hypothetical protein C8J56DRAFT_925315 [Mycena floridula]
MEILKGAESQRLRTFCTREMLDIDRDLDPYGNLLCSGNFAGVKDDFSARVASFRDQGLAEDEARQKAADGIYQMRWGPTEVPVYNILGLLVQIIPYNRPQYLLMARYLIEEAKVPVNGRDLSGTCALSHTFSTKPALDLAYAQILYDAGGEVNARNRYGGTVAHEIVTIWNKETVKAEIALKWFLNHGGNLDIADGDGVTPRAVLKKLFKGGIVGRSTMKIVEEEDQRRRAIRKTCCALCGREEGVSLRCKRCKTVLYCSPSVRGCQLLDWPRHKLVCKASP